MNSLSVEHVNRREAALPDYSLRSVVGRGIDENGDLVGIHGAGVMGNVPLLHNCAGRMSPGGGLGMGPRREQLEEV